MDEHAQKKDRNNFTGSWTEYAFLMEETCIYFILEKYN